MLVITRKVGDTIRIGNDIIIHITETGFKSVRIGVEAPKDIKIYRGEIYDKLKIKEDSNE